MAKFTIKDDCLAPERYIYLNFSGPDPYGVAKKIGGMLNSFFHVSTSGTCEYDFRWDRTGDPVGFFNRWWVQKKLSGWTTAWFHIQVQGNKSKETNEGNFTLELSAELITDIKHANPFFKAIWWIYSYIFYDKRRREYVRFCSNLAHGLRDELKEHYSLNIKGERGEK